ncbi:MAG: TonB-dependent receptor plug domain-containing protein, partial [Ekhidna sp.]
GSSMKSISLGESGSLQNLGENSALFFKNYGNGGLSTISLRGTSASHTNVLWNGIPVNSPTLGQSDYSIFPSFLIDDVTVVKGSTSSLFGSGSIGGTVVMDNSVLAKDSVVSFYSSIGSFGQWNAGVKLQLELAPKLLAETRIFYGRIENDFKYQLRGEEVRQPNAAIERKGFSQRFNYQKRNHHLFSELAYAENDREAQPTKTSASRNQLLTKNLRGVISHEQYVGDATFFTSIGYAGETTIYNLTSETIAHTFSGQYAFDFPINDWFSTRVGVNTIQSWVRSDSYSEVEQMGQLHAYSSFSLSPQKWLRASINLRESFQEDNAVFTPSLGVESMLGLFNIRMQLSEGYRIPTFNDRFWVPGGNPDLSPERSKNAELGIDFNQSNISLGATAFMSNVKDWIQWTPVNGIFTPSNLREVSTKGIEATSDISLPFSFANIHWIIDYELTLSSDESIEEENQLIYVPKHSGYSSLSVSKNNIIVVFRGNYTGVRYTTLTNSKQSELDDFMLLDLTVEKQQMFGTSNMKLRLSLNNILDKDYENVSNIAMPGRNFLTELIIKL